MARVMGEPALLPPASTAELESVARRLRIRILNMIVRARSSHLGTAYSMVDLLTGRLDVSRREALALASVVVDLRVTQVANGTWGVHAVLPPGAVSGR